MSSLSVFALLFLLLAAPAAQADSPRVLRAEATANGDGTYTIAATILHGDTGWDHYADGFDVLAPDGTLLAHRTLFHPHENEQPFTRSVDGVKVPARITEVIVRAHDKLHGNGKVTARAKLPGR